MDGINMFLNHDKLKRLKKMGEEVKNPNRLVNQT